MKGVISETLQLVARDTPASPDYIQWMFARLDKEAWTNVYMAAHAAYTKSLERPDWVTDLKRLEEYERASAWPYWIYK